jgi:hypothetical protein
MKPTEYRPTSPAAGDGDEPDEWADNKLSNSMAWASQVITPKWCQSPEHWTARLTEYLFTSCPCCLVFRGLVIGAVAGSFATMIVASLLP